MWCTYFVVAGGRAGREPLTDAAPVVNSEASTADLQGDSRLVRYLMMVYLLCHSRKREAKASLA